MVGSDALGGVPEGQGVQEDGSGDVGMDRELAGEVLQVEFLGGGLLVLLDGGDVGLEGRRIFTLAQPGRDLVRGSGRRRGRCGGDGWPGRRPVCLARGREPSGPAVGACPASAGTCSSEDSFSVRTESVSGMERVASAEQVSDLGTKHRRRQVDLVTVPDVGSRRQPRHRRRFGPPRRRGGDEGHPRSRLLPWG